MQPRPTVHYHTWTARPSGRRQPLRHTTTVVGLLALLATVIAVGPSPAPADAAAGNPAQISAGSQHTCSVASGTVLCWGEGDLGRLGNGSTADRSEPTPVTGLPTAVQVSAGHRHTCAVTTSGALYCWGDNASGQLGDATTTRRLTPVAVSGITSVTQVSAGADHTCAVAGGASYCWGANPDGRLGDGTTTRRLTPVAVSGLTSGVSQVSAGLGHSCAVRSGSARCWGEGSSGQLGNGSTADRTSPVTVSGLTSGVTQVTTGTAHSCARRSNGEVRCWGDNLTGQVGDGTAGVNRTTPVTVVGLSAATQVSAGAGHTCASTGTLAWCWGDNGLAQLGDGTGGGIRTVAAPVANLTETTAVSGGGMHSCSVSTDDRAHCWGAGSKGQIGDGLTVNVRTTPQRVLILPPPLLISPAPQHVFDFGETQLFAVRAPNADVSYIARITVTRVINGQESSFFTAPTLAGQDATGTPPTPLEPDTYVWSAQWQEVDESGVVAEGAWSPPSGTQGVAVAIPAVNCTQLSTKLADGYVGDTFIEMAVGQIGTDAIGVCQRVDDTVNAAGGLLTVTAPEGAPPPTITSTTAPCESLPGDALVDGESGDPSEPETYLQFLMDAKIDGNEVHVCLKAGNDGTDDNLAENAITIAIPTADNVIPQVSFAPYAGGPLPPPDDHDDPTQPSADCQLNLGGTRTQVLNLSIRDAHVYHYLWRDADTALACVRVRGEGGLLLGMDTEGVPGVSPVLNVGPAGPAHENPDCPIQQLHLDVLGQVFIDVHRSSPGDNPAAVCLQLNASPTITQVGSQGDPVLPEPVIQPDA